MNWPLDPPDDEPTVYDELRELTTAELLELAAEHGDRELPARIDAVLADHWSEIDGWVAALAAQIERQRLRDEGEDRAEARKAALEDYA